MLILCWEHSAAITMPDIEASIEEFNYSLDVLELNGECLIPNLFSYLNFKLLILFG